MIGRISLLFLPIFSVFFFAACNVSDEGGGLTPDCTENADCVTGICVDGECRGVAMDAGMDASNNGVEDAGDDAGEAEDTGVDMGEGMDVGVDMEVDMGPKCPEGRVDRNGDDSDGCELPDHPAASNPACEPCWNLQDAVGGCSEGTCNIVACLNGKTDRDGMVMNGCEVDCGPGECWTPVARSQQEYLRVDDDWILGSGDGVMPLTRDQGATLRWLHAENPRDFVTPAPVDYTLLDDNRIVGIQSDKIVLSDDLGLSWREASLPTAFGARTVTRSVSGRGIAAGFSGSCEVRQCPAVSCQGGEVCNAGVCEGNDCGFDSDCPGSSVCGPNSKCIDPDTTVCQDQRVCGQARCNFVGHRLLISDDFETWTTSGAQFDAAFDSIHTNADGTIIIGTDNDTLYRTTDDGANWEEEEISGCPKIRVVEWNSSDRVVLGGSNCLKFSQDNGETFNDASVPGSFGQLYDVLWLDDSTVVAAVTNAILRSNNAGLNWVRTDVVGSVRTIERMSDGTLIAIAGLQGFWTSDDDGVTWTNTREDRNPLPAEVSAGQLGVFGTDGNELLLPPSAAGVDGPWTETGITDIRRTMIFGGEAFVYSGEALWWGTDLMTVNLQPIDPNRINLRNLIITSPGGSASCGASTIDCDVRNSPVPIRNAASNANVTYVATRLEIRARISLPVGGDITQNDSFDVLMTSTNQRNWRIVDQNFFPRGAFQPTAEGMISNPFYSTSNSSVSTLSDSRCDAGPFVVRGDDAIVSFERPELCVSTDGGASWGILATANDFTQRLGTPRYPVVLRGTSLGVMLGQGPNLYLILSGDDGQNWQDPGIVLPGDVEIASDGRRQLIFERDILLRSE